MKLYNITLYLPTTFGEIKQESFEVVSKETCESWYHHKCKS